MSTAGASGAANDAAGVSVEPAEHDALRAELDALTSEMTDAERARETRRVEISHALYERDSRIEGTSAHAAHVAQLRRLRGEAQEALDRAREALRKAFEHAEGKEAAVGEASKALDAADLALAEVVGPKERGDGLE